MNKDEKYGISPFFVCFGHILVSGKSLTKPGYCFTFGAGELYPLVKINSPRVSSEMP